MFRFDNFIRVIGSRRKMRQGVQLAALIIALQTLSGCLSPVKNEIPLLSGDLSLKATNALDTKLVIFNDSNYLMFGLDGSGRINIKLNGKGVTQLNLGCYTQMIVPKGGYQLDLTHLDMGTFSSRHQIELTQPESFLEIRATPASNAAQLVPALPADFAAKFTPVR
jgi:hypothetical protein